MALTPKAGSEENSGVPPKRPGPSRFVPTATFLNLSREGGAADEILSTDKIIAKLAKPAYKSNGSSPSSERVVQTKITDYTIAGPSVNGTSVTNGQSPLPTAKVSNKKRSRSTSAISSESDAEIIPVKIPLKEATSQSEQANVSSQDEDVTPRRKRTSVGKNSSIEQSKSDRRVGSRRAALIAKRHSNSRYSPELPSRRRSSAGKAQNTYSRRSRRSHSRESDMDVDQDLSSEASSSLDFAEEEEEEDGGDFSLFLDDDFKDETNTSQVEIETTVNDEDSLPSKGRSSSAAENLVDPFNASPGDLMWARVGQPVFWACAITQEPNLHIHTQVAKKGKAICLEYHVQFFGRPLRAWVTKANLMRFLGVDDYYRRVQDAKSRKSVNTRKKLLKELIPQTQKQQWQEAFDEMVAVEEMDVSGRIAYLKKRLDEPNLPPKRRQSYASVSSIQEKKKAESASPKQPSLKPVVTEKAPKTFDPLEVHRLLVSKIPREVIEENYRKFTTGYKLFKVAKLVDYNKSLAKEEFKEAERDWNRSWNLLSKSERQYFTEAAMKLFKESEVENIKDDVSVDESVISQPVSVRTPSPGNLPIQKVSSSVVFKAEKMPYSIKNPFKKESFCILCEKVSQEEGDLLKCNGVCHNFFHINCLNTEETIDAQIWKCEDCSTNNHSCFICKSKDGNRERCSVSSCGKFYHRDCLRSSLWPQSRFSENQITCPYHMCHTCASDDPKDPHMKYNSKLLKCIRCPTSYHSGDYCVTAGTYQITTLDVICPKHFVPPKGKKAGTYHINISWCFICSSGGSLICCELCPSSFHTGCVNLDTTPDVFYCTNCETGRMPLYGEILWTKLGHYRWWPAQVMFPDELPQNVLRMPHNVGQFAVQFCGTKEFYWMNNGRCYPYQEGDSDRIPGGSGAGGSSLDSSFMKGIQEASILYEEYMENRSRSEKLNESKVRAQPHLRPPLYTKIKSNKPYGDCVILNSEAHLKCDCPATSKDPCGPTSSCLNRLLLVECHSNVCPFGDRCGNRQFQKKLYPPMKVEHTKTKGWGLFVKTDIKKGDFIIEYVGELITNEEFKKRIGNMLNNKDADQNYYFMVIDNARVIDAGPKGNYARFINHSCDPNCETVKWTVNGDTRIGIFALEDIPANTELTFNYQFEAFGEVKKPCLCGAKNCCGLIGEKAPPKRAAMNNAALVAASKKKKVKKGHKVSKKQSDDWCFRCYNSYNEEQGYVNLILCDYKDCRKAYHLECIGMETSTTKKWHCPWHHCVTCGKLASSWCDHCPNAYCKIHSEPLMKHPVLRNVCDEHLMDCADMEKFYLTLSSEYRQDRLQQITEPQVILTEGVSETKRRRTSQVSHPQHDLVNCEVDFCSWFGTKEASIVHMEALHSSRPKKTWDSSYINKTPRPREATFRCPVENCSMEMRASLLRRHIQAKHPKIFREKYSNESTFLMEMTKAKVVTPKGPASTDIRITRSPKLQGRNVPSSSAGAQSHVPGENDLTSEAARNTPSSNARQSQSPGLAPNASSNASTPSTTPKGNIFVCNFAGCDYVSKHNSNMWRHRRKYGHLETGSVSPRISIPGQGDTETQDSGRELSGSEEQTQDGATEHGSEEPANPIKSDTNGGASNSNSDDVNETIPRDFVHIQFREDPESPVEPSDAILNGDLEANSLAFGDDYLSLKQEPVEVSTSILCQSSIKTEPVEDSKNGSAEPLLIDETNS